MKYEITHHGDHYRADCKTLPGCPPVGIGATEAEAVVHLFERLLSETRSKSTPTNWLEHLDFSEIRINDKFWQWPKSYLNS